MTKTLKQTILGALEAEGGVEYMRAVARENPTVFCAPLAKLLPMTVADEKAADVPLMTKINLVPMAPKQFLDDEPKMLEKMPVKRTCE